MADWFCINEAESVYYTVSTESLYKTDMFYIYRVKIGHTAFWLL